MRYLLSNKLFLITYLSVWQTVCLYSQDGIIKGKVTNGKENISSATIQLGNETKLTNTQGEFSFQLKEGTYFLIITHAGYTKIETVVSVKANVTYNLNYTLYPIELLGEVVMLGSRSLEQRSNLSSTVPVDVFAINKLMQTGQQGLIQMLNYLAPSFNANRQVLVEPVTLRGLDPNHLLVLINGTRYHNSAWLNNGSPKSHLGRGSVGNDLNSIPFSAIEKIEILRDGSAAQYGSDAIAGVINFQLKKSINKTSIDLHAGQFYEGDGLKTTIGFNSGFPINKKGFLNYSADLRFQAPTSRGEEYKGTVFKNFFPGADSEDSARTKFQDDSIITKKGINRKMFLSNDGISQLSSSGILLNGCYPLKNNLELFVTSTINYQENLYGGSYRFPKNNNQVNLALFPNGFKPKLKSTNLDLTLISGLKGHTKSNWHWELLSSYGNNTNKNFVSNTNNASQYTMGKEAPTAFYLGRLIYTQYLNSFNLVKELNKKYGKLKSANLGMGAEWRFENYQQRAGDEASWKNYDVSGRTQGGAQPSLGSVNPENSVNENRTVSAAYIDFNVETFSHFLFGSAVRYEYYSDFGGNLAGKLSGGYKISQKIFVRGSVSNGFRAPAIQQRFYTGTQSFRGTALVQGIFSNTSNITKAFGIPSLEAEKSLNFSLGLTSQPLSNISFTADAYWIQIKNRIVLSGAFRKSNPDVAAILFNYPNIDLVQFYTNAINTRTIGIDVVLNGNWNLYKTKFGLTFAANFNQTTIFGNIKTTDKISDTARYYTNTLLGIEEKKALEKSQPGEKFILTALFNHGKFGIIFRNTLFGRTASTTIVNNPIDTLYEFFSGKTVTDFSINFTPKTWITITAGAHNIFDTYPDKLKNYRNTMEGSLIYSNGASPFGYNGGYYYTGISFKFSSKEENQAKINKLKGF